MVDRVTIETVVDMAQEEAVVVVVVVVTEIGLEAAVVGEDIGGGVKVRVTLGVAHGQDTLALGNTEAAEVMRQPHLLAGMVV